MDLSEYQSIIQLKQKSAILLQIIMYKQLTIGQGGWGEGEGESEACTVQSGSKTFFIWFCYIKDKATPDILQGVE